MRDFRAGGDINVGGNVTINEAPEHKPLAQQSNEELLSTDRRYRELLRNEVTRKNTVTWKFLAAGAALLGAAAIWAYIQGQMNLVTLLLGLGGMMITAATLNRADKPTMFEQSLLNDLNEIAILLRKRGVR